VIELEYSLGLSDLVAASVELTPKTSGGRRDLALYRFLTAGALGASSWLLEQVIWGTGLVSSAAGALAMFVGAGAGWLLGRGVYSFRLSRVAARQLGGVAVPVRVRVVVDDSGLTVTTGDSSWTAGWPDVAEVVEGVKFIGLSLGSPPAFLYVPRHAGPGAVATMLDQARTAPAAG